MKAMAMKNRLLIATLAAALLGGCVVAPGYQEPVIYEPPPPRVEYPGYAPVVGYVWISGYWTWTGHRHEWVGGRWEAPRPGYRWIAPRWERDGKYWRQHEGRWDRHEPPPRAMPAPPPRFERDRHDERRQEAPAYRQERSHSPAPAPEAPRREFDRPSRGPDTGSRQPMEARPAAPREAPRIERADRQERGRDNQGDGHRSGRGGQERDRDRDR